MVLRPGYEPIPGYTLQEPIGKGGFGEVWSALAPGGFRKAIKFVYGARGEKRAGRELRSLEHMTGVNHPFLLTLECYEFVDERLVIVSELADGSLEDVYNRQIERGSCGIPRAALLSYLSDAADALDYLHGQFQLQHLDIKPGNLLLVGGHVKVADFGLLKDLRDDACSVIGGLTPIYAPPEVFDGRPSHHSDQYSLAVMYQELLTGKRPFSGRTIAQLATQHVHSTPNLDSLPPSDRPIIARALEKDPQRRYESCHELVEALRTPRGKGIQVTSSGHSEAIGGDTQTGSFAPGEAYAVAEVENLPGLSGTVLNSGLSRTANSLVVAVGGTGADVLVELHQRIKNAGVEPAERIDSVLIDTDQEKLHIIRLLEGPDARSPCKTLYTPLRSPAEYRDGGTAHLRSISRRWIYNVPRSLSTEGMRPLGRLAMVDHGKTIMATLKAAVANSAGDSPEPPTVYLTGSLTGGTGSGMLLDLAYLLRHLLDDCGMEQSEIIPLFAGSSARPHSRNPLGNADAAAALNELQFYLKPENGYAGDPGAEWPSVPAARSPLHNTYVIANPERNDGSSTAAEIIGDYIWHSSQGAGRLLTAARKEAHDDASPLSQMHASTRSVGIVSLSQGSDLDTESLGAILARQTLLPWIGQPNEARMLAPSVAERLGPKCGFNIESFQQQLWHAWSADSQTRRVELLKSIATWPISTIASDQAIADAFATQLDNMRGGPPNLDQVESRMTSLRHELAVRLQDRRIDLNTALEVVQKLAARIKADVANMRGLPITSVAEPSSPTAAEPQTTAELEAMMENAVTRMDTMLLRAAQQGIVQRAGQLIQQLGNCAAGLLRQIDVVSEVTTRLGSRESDDAISPLPEELRSRLDANVDQLHSTLAANLLCLPLLQPDQSIDPDTLLQAALEASEERNRSTATADDPLSQQHANSAAEKLEAALVAARPPLLDLGGKQRLLLLVGSERQRDELAPQVETAAAVPVTTVIVPGTQAALIHEAQGIPLDAMIDRLTASLGGNQKITTRLQSRVDVQWPTDP